MLTGKLCSACHRDPVTSSYGETAFALGAVDQAVRWKHSTPILPEKARRPAGYVGKGGVASSTTYEFCLAPSVRSMVVGSENPLVSAGPFRRGVGQVIELVLHIAPRANAAYQESLTSPHKTLGSTVSEVWAPLIRHADRFITIDSALFLNPVVTSNEYVVRYGRPEPAC